MRRECVGELKAQYPVSERRVNAALGFPRSSHYYRCRKDSQEPLRMRLRDLAASRVRYGYRRLYVLLRREGWTVNHKRVYRTKTEAWRKEYNEERPHSALPHRGTSMSNASLPEGKTPVLSQLSRSGNQNPSLGEFI